MAELLSRSVHEDRAFMEMHPCECGDQTVDTRTGEMVATVTGMHRNYWWTCPTCRTARRFDFFTPKQRRVASMQSYGELVEAGELVAHATVTVTTAVADTRPAKRHQRAGRGTVIRTRSPCTGGTTGPGSGGGRRGRAGR